MEYFISVVKQYANFTGRARRKEYWMFVLFYIIFYFVLFAIDMLLGTGLLTLIYSLALMVPSFSVGARRLHDINRSGWWQLLYLIPVIGLIVMIVFLVTDSDPGENRFGPNPKAV